MNLGDQVRHRFPNFQTDIDSAIALAQISQPRFVELWFELSARRQIKQITKNIHFLAWGKQDPRQKGELYTHTIQLYSVWLQRLVIINGRIADLNLKPLQQLYSEMVYSV